MKWLALAALCVTSLQLFAADAPPPQAFRVLPASDATGPAITAYLKYQTEMAWQQDDQRRRVWENIRSEQDLSRLQDEIRRKLLAMIGGLPKEKTPLNARVTGRIQMPGYHIEKLIFESLPRVYVTALVYAPDDGAKHPGVLVPAGHSPKGKAYYQALCQRLVQHGYVVIAWDPVGQGERSQFWDAKTQRSRYNLICAEHAVLGNLAYLAGTNLARWEIWDGIRAVDYLLTRSDVDPDRINITGTSGGGTQAAFIAALDPRIKVAAPSCYITALPMRIYNRIFKDPDSDPEQDLNGLISEGVDHPGLLLLMYPRPVFVAAAVLDFFPIEGTHKTFREVESVYARFGHADRIALVEGYHEHQFSPENQEAAVEFLDHFNGLSRPHKPTPTKDLDDNALQCTRTGQVMLDYQNAKSLMDDIHDYYSEHPHDATVSEKQLYFSATYPKIKGWQVAEYRGGVAEENQIQWELAGTSTSGGAVIDRYLLHYGRYLSMPLLRIHSAANKDQKVLLWLGDGGKVSAADWPALTQYLNSGYEIISFDLRGQGETRMPYKAISPDDPSLAKENFDHAYVNPLSSVLADYVYNSVLTGRPYFLQMMEDVEIAEKFASIKFGAHDFEVTGDAATLASAVSEVLPNTKLLPAGQSRPFSWREAVEQKRELWPIEDLLPGGAYIH